MRIKDIKESASMGATGAGSIATIGQTTGKMNKRASIYDEKQEPSSYGTSGFAFYNELKKNPHFVKFHELNATSAGYYAKVELDDGHIYDLELSISK